MDSLEDSLWDILKDSLEDSETNSTISEVEIEKRARELPGLSGRIETGIDENETEVACASVRCLLEN